MASTGQPRPGAGRTPASSPDVQGREPDEPDAAVLDQVLEDPNAPAAAKVRHRTLTGALGFAQRLLLIAIPVLGLLFVANVHLSLGWLIFTEQWVGLFLSMGLVGVFLTFPAVRGKAEPRLPWYDALLALIAALPGLYLAVAYPTIVRTFGAHDALRATFSAIAIVVILEAIRRTTGWPLVIVVAVFLVYAKFGTGLPAIAAQPTGWMRLLSYLYVDPGALLGMLKLAATIALAFVTFGQLLLKFGVGNSLTNISLLILGRFRGGSAKTALLGSSLVGTITGAPMSNVFLTGSITIPMMIRSGYRPATAGGIEATVSTGGQIMPPVMGIAAFIVAENLGVPYSQVALAALIPALLFYLGAYVQIDLEAGKRNLRGLSREELPRFVATMKEAWVVVPILGILIYTLFIIRMNPTNAAAVSTVAALPFLVLQSANRRGLVQRVVSTLESSGRLLLDVTTVLAAAGFVVGVASVSGLGFRIGFAVLELSGSGGVLVVLLIAAVASMFLGMGMPTVAAYALVAVLVAPALTDFGISPMAAHLFILYFAVLANITPPIAVAAFAGAFLAQASPLKTGFEAMRVGILIYIIPFLFVFRPELLLEGEPTRILLYFMSAAIGVLLLGFAVMGYATRPLRLPSRAAALLGAALLMAPLQDGGTLLVLRSAGAAIALAFLAAELLVRRTAKAQQPPAAEPEVTTA